MFLDPLHCLLSLFQFISSTLFVIFALRFFHSLLFASIAGRLSLIFLSLQFFSLPSLSSSRSILYFLLLFSFLFVCSWFFSFLLYFFDILCFLLFWSEIFCFSLPAFLVSSVNAIYDPIKLSNDAVVALDTPLPIDLADSADNTILVQLSH